MLTVLSILGNMVSLPFIMLYLKKLAIFLKGKNQTISQFLDLLFERAKEKAGLVKEFQWLGLMLFVAISFPRTGAWTEDFIASILDMPFWHKVIEQSLPRHSSSSRPPRCAYARYYSRSSLWKTIHADQLPIVLLNVLASMWFCFISTAKLGTWKSSDEHVFNQQGLRTERKIAL